MAVQDDLAAALSAIAAATNSLNTIGAQATDAINRVTAAYTARLATLRASYYVNQITGSDANPGTPTAPLRSIQAAIDKVPLGGHCSVLLQSDFTTTDYIVIRNKFVYIGSADAGRRVFTPGLGIDNSFSPASRILYGFRFSGMATLSLYGVRVIIPAIDGYSSYSNRQSADLFLPISGGEVGPFSAAIIACDLSLPLSPFGALVPDQNFALHMSDLALTGASQSLNGKVVRNVTNASGTAANTLPYLLTNLATV